MAVEEDVPEKLTLTLSGTPPQSYIEKYVGVWLHKPLSSNPHVFEKEDGSCTLYWQDDRYHWRTGSRASADPSGGSFGCGSWYLRAPSPEQKYTDEYCCAKSRLKFFWHKPPNVILTCVVMEGVVRCTNISGEEVAFVEIPEAQEPYGSWLYGAVRETVDGRLALMMADGSLIEEAYSEDAHCSEATTAVVVEAFS